MAPHLSLSDPALVGVVSAEPAVASVIFSMDADGSSGYTVVHTETTALPESSDRYYLGTNNNGSGGAYTASAPAWDTDTSAGSWTVSGTSASKSDGSWGQNYILGKNALGSANQTATDINFGTSGTASWIGFVREDDLTGAQYDEAVNQFGFYLDNGVSRGIFCWCTISAKLVNIKQI